MYAINEVKGRTEINPLWNGKEGGGLVLWSIQGDVECAGVLWNIFPFLDDKKSQTKRWVGGGWRDMIGQGGYMEGLSFLSERIYIWWELWRWIRSRRTYILLLPSRVTRRIVHLLKSWWYYKGWGLEDLRVSFFLATIDTHDLFFFSTSASYSSSSLHLLLLYCKKKKKEDWDRLWNVSETGNWIVSHPSLSLSVRVTLRL